MSESKKIKHHTELTEEVLLACPTPVARASLVMSVMGTLLEQYEAGIKALNKSISVSQIQETAGTRGKLISVYNAVRTDAERFHYLSGLLRFAFQDLINEYGVAGKVATTRLQALGMQGGTLEVMDEHRDAFYKQFVEFMTPFAAKGNKKALFDIDSSNKKKVLKNALGALIDMVTVANSYDDVPKWMVDTYGVGTNFGEFIKDEQEAQPEAKAPAVETKVAEPEAKVAN